MAALSNRGAAKRPMLGAAIGDIAGSIYEFDNIKRIPDMLIAPGCRFTDDTVLSCAVAQALADVLGTGHGRDELVSGDARCDGLRRVLAARLKEFGRAFPSAGYGGSFRQWLSSPGSEPYGSWGNGSGMRASACGWAALSLAEAELLGELSASVTHSHELGLKGARTIAGCIFVARSCMAAGASPREAQEAVRSYAARAYDLGFTLDDIRPTYRFDVSCEGSVPQAVEAFLEAESFEGAIGLAISIGGDSDTIAAMAGSMAEAVWPIPTCLAARAEAVLAPRLLEALRLAGAWLA